MASQISARWQWWSNFAGHYIRDMVWAANDGIVTTFAVVAGARGAGLSGWIVLALGFANLAADGLSMAVGDYLGIKSERAAELQDGFKEWSESLHAAKHGMVTWVAFVVAGLAPLLPFLSVLRRACILELGRTFGTGAVHGRRSEDDGNQKAGLAGRRGDAAGWRSCR